MKRTSIYDIKEDSYYLVYERSRVSKIFVIFSGNETYIKDENGVDKIHVPSENVLRYANVILSINGSRSPVIYSKCGFNIRFTVNLDLWELDSNEFLNHAIMESI